MIKVYVTHEQRPGVWAWKVWDGRGDILEGVSRTPLFAACRALKRTGVDLGEFAGLYWPGAHDWSLQCSIGWGADKTVEEGSHRGPWLRKWEPFKHA